MYRVICAFNDLLDNSFLYKVGDVYPRRGIHPSDARVSALCSENNLQHRPLIERVVEAVDEEVDNDDIKPAKKKRGKKNENS